MRDMIHGIVHPTQQETDNQNTFLHFDAQIHHVDKKGLGVLEFQTRDIERIIIEDGQEDVDRDEKTKRVHLKH